MKKKDNLKQPKFNSYWIYAIIVSFLLFISMFNDDSINKIRKTNISEFERYLNDGDVKEVAVINKNIAKVTLNESALNKSIHQGLKSKNFLGNENINGPHYQFEIGDLELFQKKLEKAEENEISFGYYFKTVENKWMDVIIGFLPIIVIIAIWVFIMRRMSGGAGGGPGSQIFNIGKSKAKLFDQNSDIKITFKDVAGLEAAKEEVQEIVDFLIPVLPNILIYP